VSERLLVRCAVGVVEVDLEDETVDLGPEAEIRPRAHVDLSLPRVVDVDAVGARVVVVVDRRPPLVVSDDAGATWRETGSGLPAGRAVALLADHPDTIAFASSDRLYVSRDGGIFWRRLAVELPEIDALRWIGTNAPAERGPASPN